MQLLTKCYSEDQIMKNEMGGAFDTYGGYVRCIQNFSGKSTHSWEDNIKVNLQERG
jgi:hypothetical protein